jgi:phage-related protein
LDDKFFISFNKSLSEVFSGIESFIDSIGGIKSIFLSVGSVILGLVANNIEPALKNIAHNITVIFTGAKS